MREDAFRAYLAPRLGGATVVASYLSNARLVERRLAVDLDDLPLGEGNLSLLRGRLLDEGVSREKTANWLAAVRQCNRFRDCRIAGPNNAPIGLAATAVGGRNTMTREPSPIVSTLDTPGLMRLYGDLIAELRKRGVSRTANGPVGDDAEPLFARAFGWRLARNSERGFDAIDVAGQHYQIKARRLRTPTASRQLSAIRRLTERTFDALVAILFDEAMAVRRAVLMPYDLVVEHARRVKHTNSWRMMMSDQLCALPGVVDVTEPLRRVAL